MQRPEFLRGLEHVVVDVERGPHERIIMHHASDVNADATRSNTGS
jgi:hypothetical protein